MSDLLYPAPAVPEVRYELSISAVLAILTKSMKSMNATADMIATMQKEFLNQFGISATETFELAIQDSFQLDDQKKQKLVDTCADKIVAYLQCGSAYIGKVSIGYLDKQLMNDGFSAATIRRAKEKLIKNRTVFVAQEGKHEWYMKLR